MEEICYPKQRLEFEFEILWKESDTTSMSINELQNRIKDIADWISKVEKITCKYQPN